MVVDLLLRVPSFGQRDMILVLSREPAGESCVSRPQASVFSRKKKSFVFLSFT